MQDLEPLQNAQNHKMRADSPGQEFAAKMELENYYRSELQTVVEAHARERRGADIRIFPFDANYVPGVLRKKRIPKGNGKFRIVYVADDYDYVQFLYIYHGTVLPLVENRLSAHSHAFRPNRGIRTQIRQILDKIRKDYPQQLLFIGEDVKDCFSNVPLGIILDELPPHARKLVKLLQQRYQELSDTCGPKPNGGPQGHPIIPALVNLVLETILQPIRQRFEGRVMLLSYADDLAFIGTGTEAREMRKEVNTALKAYGVSFNSAKSRATRIGPGTKIVTLGLELEWEANDPRPSIRPERKAYQRLSDKIAGATDNATRRSIEKGWRNHYDPYCTEPDHKLKTQHAVEEGARRRSSDTTKPPGPYSGGI